MKKKTLRKERERNRMRRELLMFNLNNGKNFRGKIRVMLFPVSFAKCNYNIKFKYISLNINIILSLNSSFEVFTVIRLQYHFR